ncbi:MAG: CDP-archaeol synthase [Deltaproteobacteria bacterium]|nr:CDP-archaeol synthase [Deltaproteobacteria bacterium]MBW2420352.1 CDP-archaeol synthase [Deltaproteobacteria bacterium]
MSEDAQTAPAPGEPFHPKPATAVPERPEKKGLSELSRRLLTAAVLVPAVIYIIIFGGLVYLATVALFTLIGQREFYGMIEDKGAHPLVGVGLGFGLAVTVVAYVGNEYHATLLLTASLLVLMVAQLRKARIEEALASISGTFFGVFYVGWLLSHAVVLRFFYGSVASKYDADDVALLELAPESGVFFMIYTLAVVVCCDAGAYFAGRAWGRRKLAPEISPNKSVEGALGGVVVGTLAGVVAKLVFDFFWPELSAMISIEAAAVFGVVLSMVGIVGDLVESLLKRDAAVKDTGALLPGMGGVLDRIDAPLLAIPVMYYMLLGYVFIQVG